jgi:CubicO group peptidase (beta-lactamase class C family)
VWCIATALTAADSPDAAGHAKPLSRAQLATRIDAQAQPWIDSQHIVGMTIGVVRGDDTLVQGYGECRASGTAAPHGQTIYEIGSVTKVMTGLLLADAVVRGEVRLDQPAAELLPEDIAMPARDGVAITLQQLSTHVSGLPRLPNNMQFGDLENPYADYTDELLWEFLDQHKLRRLPGRRMEYSNLAVGLLGQLLARAADTNYERLVFERIATPLGMADTTITLDEAARERLAYPHTTAGLTTKNWDLGPLAGAGAVRSTVDDMLKFAQAMLNPPAAMSEAINLAWQVQQPAIAKQDLDMGLGWHLARDGETRWHNGQTGGYHSMLMVSRKHNCAVVILANTAAPEVDKLANDVMRIACGEQVDLPDLPKVATVAPEAIERLVGEYSLMPLVQFRIRVRDGRLMAQLTGQGELRLYPESATRWKYRAVDAEITFQLNEQGECLALELFQHGVRRTAKRIDK